MNKAAKYVGPLVNPFWESGKGKEEFPGAPPIPRSAADITPELLNQIIHPVRPDVTIDNVEVIDAASFGIDPDIISSANRVKMRVKYSADTPNAASLPTALLLKV